jgi:hypothetical protein
MELSLTIATVVTLLLSSSVQATAGKKTAGLKGEGGAVGASTESLWAAAAVVVVDVASPPPAGGGILSVWLAKAAASGMQQAAKTSVVPNAGAAGENMVTAPLQDVWSVMCSTCSKAQVESCLLSTAMDAPSRTYDRSAAVFHAADTYDCLVNTDGCCAADAVDVS